MFFDTPVYFLFLILTVLIYWRLGWRRQNVFILAASYFFYGWWDWRFLLLMISSTTIDFIIAKKIDDSPDAAKRRLLLIASLVVNFSILGFFKYFNFFLGSTAHLLDALGVHNIPRGCWAFCSRQGYRSTPFRKWPTSSMCMAEKLKLRETSSTMRCSSACFHI